jgi:hypothetical protein
MPLAGSAASRFKSASTRPSAAASFGSLSTMAALPPAVHAVAVQSCSLVGSLGSGTSRPSSRSAARRLSERSTAAKPWSLTTTTT